MKDLENLMKVGARVFRTTLTNKEGRSCIRIKLNPMHLNQTESEVSSTISLYEDDTQLALAVHLRKREI